MQGDSSARVNFIDGFVLNRNWIIIAAYLFDYPDYEMARIFTYRDGQWLHVDLNFRIRSIWGTLVPAKKVYCLGIDGRISVRLQTDPVQELIPDAGAGAGKYGYLYKIREIGGMLYVCGVSGQIYRREPTGWVHFDNGVLRDPTSPEPKNLYSIDGTSATDIYTVGQKGLLFHFDGTGWTRLDPPTSANLNAVKCVSPQEVWLCGAKGGIFRGHRGARWQSFPVKNGAVRQFWSIEVFQGSTYFADGDRVYTIEDGNVVPVNTGLNPVPDAVRLHANDGVLWCFGNQRLAFFDGRNWTAVRHPDND